MNYTTNDFFLEKNVDKIDYFSQRGLVWLVSQRIGDNRKCS